MLSDPIHLTLLILICLLLSAISVAKNIFDLSGGIFAFFYGLIVGFFGGFRWLLIMLFFLILTHIITKTEFKYKKIKRINEGNKGERSIPNIIANGLIPLIIALLSNHLSEIDATFLFTVALSVSAADTFASEIGSLSKKVYLITNFKRVEPGTNGGISALGTFAALIGSINISLISLGVLWGEYPFNYFVLSVLLGLVGCMIDSLLGALLENKGYLEKNSVNLISIGAAVIIALLFI